VEARAYNPLTSAAYGDSTENPTGTSILTRVYFTCSETLNINDLYVRFAGMEAVADSALDTNFVMTIDRDTIPYDTLVQETLTFSFAYIDTVIMDTTFVGPLDTIIFSQQHLDTIVFDTVMFNNYLPFIYFIDTLIVDTHIYEEGVSDTTISDTVFLAWDIEQSFPLDTTLLDTLYVDTLRIYRNAAFYPFSDIQASFAYHGDSLWYDTLNFRTVGSTALQIPRRYDSYYGRTSSHAFTISGFRSPGMDVYCSRSTTAIDTAYSVTDSEYVHREWEYSMTVADGAIDTMSFWGINEVGASSDTLIVTRKYKRIFGFKP
jgi:hypothetical protein